LIINQNDVRIEDVIRRNGKTFIKLHDVAMFVVELSETINFLTIIIFLRSRHIKLEVPFSKSLVQLEKWV
jgi:hypothetical protein